MKTLNEGLFKKKTVDEKAEYLKYKELKKKYNPIRKRIGRRIVLGSVLGTMLLLNSVMGWHHISPELYTRYQQYNNELENRIEQLNPEERANFEKELSGLKQRLNITDNVDINKMDYKDFVNFVDKKKNLLDNEDYKSLATKGIQVGFNTGKNIKNAFWKILNKFGIQNPFEGSQIKVRSPFYMKENKNMTFREYLQEAEENKKRFLLGRIKKFMKKAVIGVFLGCGLALSVANANAEEIVNDKFNDLVKIENNIVFGDKSIALGDKGVILGEKAKDLFVDKVTDETYEKIKDAGITAYDKAAETAKDLTRKGMNLAGTLKNKASELNSKENIEKIQKKIPSKNQIKNFLKKSVDKAVEGYEIAKDKAKEIIE